MPTGVYGPEFAGAEPNGYWINMRQDRGSEIPLFADSPWVGAWPDDTDLFPTDLDYGFQDHAPGKFMGRFCGNRHDMAINVAFLDTSVRRVPLPGLWRLLWHKKFVPGEPR